MCLADSVWLSNSECICTGAVWQSISLNIYIYAWMPFPPKIWLYTFSPLNLAVYIRLSMSGCLLHYVCLSLLGFCCLAVNMCPAVFFLSVNVWLAMTGCRSGFLYLAVFFWLSIYV
jgi:hypothetical protein